MLRVPPPHPAHRDLVGEQDTGALVRARKADDGIHYGHENRRRPQRIDQVYNTFPMRAWMYSGQLW